MSSVTQAGLSISAKGTFSPRAVSDAQTQNLAAPAPRPPLQISPITMTAAQVVPKIQAAPHSQKVLYIPSMTPFPSPIPKTQSTVPSEPSESVQQNPLDPPPQILQVPSCSKLGVSKLFLDT